MAHSVNLSWTGSADSVSGYNVYRGSSAGGEGPTPLNAALITGTTFDDTTVVPGNWFYVVKSVLNGVSSQASNEVEATILPAPPSALVIVSEN
jgi:hypothetical protein